MRIYERLWMDIYDTEFFCYTDILFEDIPMFDIIIGVNKFLWIGIYVQWKLFTENILQNMPLAFDTSIDLEEVKSYCHPSYLLQKHVLYL